MVSHLRFLCLEQMGVINLLLPISDLIIEMILIRPLDSDEQGGAYLCREEDPPILCNIATSP